jgi:ABC-type transporter Mla subunit MlaD
MALDEIELPNINYDNNTSIRIFLTTYGDLINKLVGVVNTQSKLIQGQAEQIKNLTDAVQTLGQTLNDGI